VSLYDFAPPGEEELAQLIGPEPEAAPFDPQEFEANPFARILERVAMSPQAPQPRPRDFWQGLAGGFASGLRGEGARVATARERFEKRQDARRLTYDEERRKETEKYREKRSDAIRDAYKAHRVTKDKQTEYERDNPMVTEQDAAASPMLASLVGQRVPVATLRRAQMGDSPAETRAADAGVRAADSAARAARMEERQHKLDALRTVQDLRTSYRMDDDIKGYQNTVKHYGVGVSAARQNNGIGDHALIFSYMRAREPENPNAVREGEFDTASKAVGAIQNVALKASLRRFMRGDILLPEGRQMILDMMKADVEAKRPTFEIANRQYRNSAGLLGIDDPESFFLRDPQPAPARGAEAGRDPLSRQRAHAELDSLRRGGAR
jgi:hypothetical protein